MAWGWVNEQQNVIFGELLHDTIIIIIFLYLTNL